MQIQKNGREEFKEFNFKAASEHWFEKLLKLLFRYLFFVGSKFCFLSGHLYKKLQADISDFDIANEWKNFPLKCLLNK